MPSEIIDLMFYQHCHDKNYHHDIYVLNRKARLNHLVHHLHKYNNAGISPTYWLEDMLACLLSMAGTMNLHLDKELAKLLHHEIKNIDDITSLYSEEAVPSLVDENLRLLSKTMESLDHVEAFDYNGVLRNCITTLVILAFQLNIMEDGKSNGDFIHRWMHRLEMIKTKHCFHDYFDECLRKGSTNYVMLRDRYLPIPRDPEVQVIRHRMERSGMVVVLRCPNDRKQSSHKFVNGKILLTEEATFSKVQDALYKLGYRWIASKKMEETECGGKVNSLFFYSDGQIKYSSIVQTDSDWYQRTSTEYKFVDNELIPVKEWERGDPGPAPFYYVFEDTPPSEEEAPTGYMTSASGREFQRVEAAMFWCGVRIVLEPDTTKLEVQVEKLMKKRSEPTP